MADGSAQTNTEFGGLTIARALKSEKVDALFGIIGAADLVVGEGEKLGIHHYVLRHEQAGGFAADGYARAARKAGVAYTSVGPGMANAVGAMHHAAGANSPVVLLAGGTPPIEDRMNAAQQGSAAVTLADIGKWSHRVLEPSTTAFWVRRALRESVVPTPGPVTLEIPTKIISMRGTQDQVKYPGDRRVSEVPMTAADPEYVARITEAIAAAKRPVIIAADGVYWSDAARELREFAEMLQVPTCTRRMARGAFAEDHALSFTPALRRGFLLDADLICLIGQQVTGMDEWFEAPDWNPDATWIQIQETAQDIWFGLPTDLAAVGTSKLVLRQMIDYARQLPAALLADRTDWTRRLVQVKADAAGRMRANLDKLRGREVIHPQVLASEIAAFLDPSSTLIYDSFTVSNYLTGQMQATRAGQIIDAGLFQTLGHSIGMAIGAQVARPGHKVMAVIGDGGFGIAGMDMESMVRYKLPVVVVLYNNSSFGGRGWAHDLYYPERNSGNFMPGIRYDNMFREVGCHTEHVVRADEIRPALERAFASGLPALVNVVGEDDKVAAIRQRVNLLDVWSRGNFDTLSEEAKSEMRGWPYSVFERSAKRSRDNLLGFEVTTEELISMVRPDFDK